MSVENWKELFDIVGVIAVLLALIAGIGVLRTGNIINERQSAQLRAFDKALTDAKTEQGKQQERAAKAEKALSEVSNVAGAANERAGEANEKAGKANERAARLELDAAAANLRVEELRADNLNLQKLMRPRRLWGFGDDPESTKKREALAAFPGMYAVIFVVPDFEAITFARDIAGALQTAGWAVEMRVEERVSDGTSVYSGEFVEPNAHVASDSGWFAGEALVAVINDVFTTTDTGLLKVTHVPADLLSPETKTFSRPPNSVAVAIGLRPLETELLVIKHRSRK